jgi:hypothetical protein
LIRFDLVGFTLIHLDNARPAGTLAGGFRLALNGFELGLIGFEMGLFFGH